MSVVSGVLRLVLTRIGEHHLPGPIGGAIGVAGCDLLYFVACQSLWAIHR